MIQIEALETIKLPKEMGGSMEKGDRKTFLDPEQAKKAARYVTLGWAKDLSGKLATGVRQVKGVAVDVQNTTAKQAAKEI